MLAQIPEFLHYDVVKEVTSRNFGLLIGFILPGFAVIWGLSHISPTVTAWLGATSDAPTLGGFLYVTIASVAMGLTVSTVRWGLIDPIHHSTGIKQPAWNFRNLGPRTAAFETLIEIHYRFYLWYANMVIALPVSVAIRWYSTGFNLLEAAFVLAMEILFFISSRDTLAKYYMRVEGLLED